MSGPENIPAFPFPEVRDADGCGILQGSTGMTLRDWFAGQALAGAASGISVGGMTPEEIERDCTEMARVLYLLADAMLAARGDA